MMIKRLRADDIDPGFLKTFNHRQHITQQWAKHNDSWVLEECDLLRQWRDEKRVWLAEYLSEQSEKGAVFGAFSDKQLVGFCAVDSTLAGKTAKYLNLTLLFVDDAKQRQGIGRELFKEVCRFARKAGAEKLFISAVPSFETVAFYLALGCTDAAEIVEEFIDTDEDRCMEFCLKE